MSHLLDANCFIDAKERYYRFPVCPGYWDWLADANARGVVFSVDKVRDELVNGGGELAVRAQGAIKNLFLKPHAAVIQQFALVAAWVAQHPQYRQSAKDLFLAGADPWLIAHAMAHNWTVVTLEKPAPQALKTIKIPDVCAHFGVVYKDPFQLLEEDGAIFTL
jgi:hypothetical protein